MLDCVCRSSWPGSVPLRVEHISDSNSTQTLCACTVVAAAVVTFQMYKLSALCLKRWHVLPFKAHLRQLHQSALLSAVLPLSQCSYSLVLTSLAHLCLCPDWNRATSLLVATGQDEDMRSWRVQRVPLGDKVVQWVLQTGGNGTDKPPCTTVTFNQLVLNCRLGPKMGQQSIFGKP